MTEKVTEFKGHWSKMKKNPKWLSTEDIEGLGDVPVRILRVVRIENAEFEGGRKETVHALELSGTPKRMVLNTTNMRAIKAIHGKDTGDWFGKRITLFIDPTRKKVGGKRGEVCDGLGVRPKAPGDNVPDVAPAQPDDEMPPTPENHAAYSAEAEPSGPSQMFLACREKLAGNQESIDDARAMLANDELCEDNLLDGERDELLAMLPKAGKQKPLL